MTIGLSQLTNEIAKEAVREDDGCQAITTHGPDGYVVLVATTKNPERYALLKGLHQAWYPDDEDDDE